MGRKKRRQRDAERDGTCGRDGADGGAQ